jgi:hypothetical protein
LHKNGDLAGERLFMEPLIKSTCANWRANQSPIKGESRRNTLCISRFSQRRAAVDLPSRRVREFIQRFPKLAFGAVQDRKGERLR